MQKALTVKKNIDQIDSIKIKNFCPSKDTITKEVTKQEKILVQIPSKGLISKIYKQFLQINKKKNPNNPIE